MTLKTRIIPVVTWDGLTAVNTKQFRDPQSIGSMRQVLSVYENRQCDELVILDIAATREMRGPKYADIWDLTGPIFCPVAYGGGITKRAQVRELIKGGVDKAIIGHGTVGLFQECRSQFGSQSIVATVDNEGPLGPSVALAILYAEAGAGEILLTSILRQGMRKGYDLELIRAVSRAVCIPVVANGGCGEPQHMLEALQAGAHAVAAGTMFAFTEWTPRSCAEWLAERGVKVRLDR
jgi:imidazole glycerol-phosphate synthase subunit HisF